MPSVQDAGTLALMGAIVLVTALAFNRLTLLPTDGHAFHSLHFLATALFCTAACLAGSLFLVAVTAGWAIAAAIGLLHSYRNQRPLAPPPRPGEARLVRGVI